MAGIKFRRQHPIGPFIVDFFCPEASLAIEIDGAVHDRDEVATQDERRSQALERLGISILRVTSTEVLERLEAVVTAIEQHIEEHRELR